MHPQSPPITIRGTVLKESDGLVILGVTFYSKLTFEKHLCLVSRAASQRLGTLGNSWGVFHDRSLLERCDHFLRGFYPACFGIRTVLHCSARLLIQTLNYWTVQSVVPDS